MSHMNMNMNMFRSVCHGHNESLAHQQQHTVNELTKPSDIDIAVPASGFQSDVTEQVHLHVCPKV